MHIPDGFLDARTAVVTGALSLAGLGLALRQARLQLPARKIPLLGLMAAFVFAAQMLNFPVAGGTSGHLIGSVLTAVLLGPSAAVIVLSAVLLVQCLLFADGGITSLGANIFNMALIGGVGGWLVYHTLTQILRGLSGKFLAVIVAAWISTVAASIACAGELSTSGTVAWKVIFPAMTGIHMLIGIGEAIITAFVLSTIANVRPDLLGLASRQSPGQSERLGPVLVYGLLISIGLAVFVAPFACSLPDGLDQSAEMLGFQGKANKHRALPVPIPDYKMPGIHSERIATSVAGTAGIIVVFGLLYGLAKTLYPKPIPETVNHAS